MASSNFFDSETPQPSWDPKDANKQLSEEERKVYYSQGNSQLYGEIEFSGVKQALKHELLDLKSADRIVDIGSGRGKLILQLLEECVDAEEFVGVEMVNKRFCASRENAMKFAEKNGYKASVTTTENKDPEPGSIIETIKIHKGSRSLTLHHGSALSIDISAADVIFCDVNIMDTAHKLWRPFFFSMKTGARIVCYYKLEHVYKVEADEEVDLKKPLPAITSKKKLNPAILAGRFSNIFAQLGYISLITSWSRSPEGHTFSLYKRI